MPSIDRFNRRFLALAVSTALASGTAWAQSSIDDLGTLGGSESAAYGVSANGSVVVGEAQTVGDAAWRAFRWTSGGMVDLGTLGGTSSFANGVSTDGSVVVGRAYTAGNAVYHAFRWTSGGMFDLGTLGGSDSAAYGVSADGSVVVGDAQTASNAARRAFRWTSGGMVDLGTLGGTNSFARGVSANGSVVVGYSDMAGNAVSHAFRWTSGGMVDLGTLGGSNSFAYGVSADGSVVVGLAKTGVGFDHHAFRWASGGMVDLGTLGGSDSAAIGVSANGSVVVGYSDMVGNAARRAFRWTADAGMQSVEDWLRDAGVSVPADITWWANATNSDGSVVVGQLLNTRAFIARVSPLGSGLITLADLQQSLAGTAAGGSTTLSSGNLLINGAHSRPLVRRVAGGQNTFWLAGDWGRDDHGARSGQLGLAEAGIGRNFGPVQLNVSLGQTWAKQEQVQHGRARSDGSYLLAEALVPLSGKLWATLGGFRHWGDSDLKRGYLNAGGQDFSTGTPDVDTWGLRARLEVDKAYHLAGADVSPYVDLSYTEAKLAAYTETGGGFPVRFDARKDKASELRVGANGEWSLANDISLVGLLEAAHRFEKDGPRTSGEVLGLFAFDIDGVENKRNWLRAGFGVEGKLAGGSGSLMVNATTQGSAPNAWLAANWQMPF